MCTKPASQLQTKIGLNADAQDTQSRVASVYNQLAELIGVQPKSATRPKLAVIEEEAKKVLSIHSEDADRATAVSRLR